MIPRLNDDPPVLHDPETPRRHAVDAPVGDALVVADRDGKAAVVGAHHTDLVVRVLFMRGTQSSPMTPKNPRNTFTWWSGGHVSANWLPWHAYTVFIGTELEADAEKKAGKYFSRCQYHISLKLSKVSMRLDAAEKDLMRCEPVRQC